MEQNSIKLRAVSAMFNLFPQSVGDVDLALRTIKAFLEPYPDDLVVQACKRFLTGKVPGQNKDFAPSLPRFIEELDEMQQREKLLNGEVKPPVYVLPENHFQNRWKRGEVEIAGPEARARVRKMIGGGDASNG